MTGLPRVNPNINELLLDWAYAFATGHGAAALALTAGDSRSPRSQPPLRPGSYVRAGVGALPVRRRPQRAARPRGVCAPAGWAAGLA